MFICPKSSTIGPKMTVVTAETIDNKNRVANSNGFWSNLGQLKKKNCNKKIFKSLKKYHRTKF